MCEADLSRPNLRLLLSPEPGFVIPSARSLEKVYECTRARNLHAVKSPHLPFLPSSPPSKRILFRNAQEAGLEAKRARVLASHTVSDCEQHVKMGVQGS